MDNGALRVALIAGTLARGGAEKQLVYMARALRDRGCSVRVYCADQGEYFSTPLREMGMEPHWFGRRAHPGLRAAALAAQLRPFRPHVVQATHAFTSLYAALAGKALGALRLGALRSNPAECERNYGRIAAWLFRTPDALIVNSQSAAHELISRWGVSRERVFWVSNAIDASVYDAAKKRTEPEFVTVVFAARLVRGKRLDVFLRAIAAARQTEPRVRALIAGDGPERQPMEALATELNLGPPDVRFVGACDDMPELLGKCDILVLSSDSEGTPNVALEAMAARLPVVSTAAGDAPLLVENGITGFLTRLGDHSEIANRIVCLAADPDLRRRMGQAGRLQVERRFGLAAVAERLLEVYLETARLVRNRRTVRAATDIASGAALST